MKLQIFFTLIILSNVDNIYCDDVSVYPVVMWHGMGIDTSLYTFNFDLIFFYS